MGQTIQDPPHNNFNKPTKSNNKNYPNSWSISEKNRMIEQIEIIYFYNNTFSYKNLFIITWKQLFVIAFRGLGCFKVPAQRSEPCLNCLKSRQLQNGLRQS